ncbi:glucan biosynthesis protein [Albimonas pacifica]|uniref:Glucans biosynthesis protein n=1 Tax=Albimonas pacifica TaxID=1114924 RepID=A0A1I3FR82_9RHOB|nr:glucan biosynthesis protein D [Albimonas pacifica]SFI13431.1 glucans biosynthesis protein [Albimonas pacifica]
MTATRRAVLGSVAALGALSAAGLGPARAQGERRPFSWDQLVSQAERAAAEPWREPYRPMPEVTSIIDYQRWGEIRFRTDRAPFQDGYPVTFFHLGQYFQKSVRMHTVADGQAQEFAYDPALFDMPADHPARRLPADSGFAGFRFQEWNGAQDWPTQDWLAFLGASYLRAIGASGQYGLSARGVAVDPALPDRPEEFPDFTEFWIEQGGGAEDPCTVYARLDGPSISGAFRFQALRTPDRARGVIIEVDANLFLRRDVERLGLTPLTSMFWYGEYGRERPFDWRPEVHDSDGLALWTSSGERLWRPLNNPRYTQVSAFLDENPRGFGLLQRDREFDHYRDGVFYDRRPSLWIEPLSPFGRGAVQLLEIPTNDEIHDNIGVFWVPEAPARAGNAYRMRYRMHWLDGEPYPATNIAQTVATRFGRGGQPGHARPDDAWKVAVEFDRPEVMRKIPYGVMPEVVASTSAGRIARTLVEPVPGGNVWRAFFDLQLDDPAQVAELRLYLALNGEPLTETWTYRFERGTLVQGI